MAKNIDPSLKLISDYLKLKKGENFTIPEYQRGYSWNITQCDKLWQDIEGFIESGAEDPYFFGTIIVDCSVNNEFSLIDGQQRTTTFLLLLKSLLLRINEAIPKVIDDEESQSLKAGLEAKRSNIMRILYKAEAEDLPAMLKDNTKTHNIVILENKSINELFSDEVKKILESNDFITAEQKVHKIEKKLKDNKYTNYFRNFKYFYEKLGDKSESQLNSFAKAFLENCQVIEIRSWQIEQAIMMFNSLNSTGLPLTSADIIAAQLYSKAGIDKKDFNEQWADIKKTADYLSCKNIIDIDGVLQQFMYINRALNKEYLTDIDTIDVTTPGLRRYYTEIKKDLLDKPLVLCSNLNNIVNIWKNIKDLPNVKLLLKFNENAKLFFSGFLNRYDPSDITEESITVICDCLIRLFSLLELSDIGYSSKKFKTFLFGENLKLVDKKIPIETLKKDFDEHIQNNWKENEIEETIITYDKNILVFLNEYIYTKSKKLKFNFADNVNIEHIMPSSGRNIVTIQQDAGIKDIDEFELIVNKLGNKILLEENINKSIGNEWFKTKKQKSVLDKSGYKDSKYALAISLISFPKDIWTKDDIEIATQKAAKRILKFIFNKNGD